MWRIPRCMRLENKPELRRFFLKQRMEQPRAEKAAAMAELLRSRTALPVILWDERRTTIDAHQILMAGGKNAKKRKKVVDAVAASLILEGYLTYKKSHPEG